MKKTAALRLGIIFAVMLIISPAAYAMHPLITDEAETNGAGKTEVEFNSEYGYDKETHDGFTNKEKEFEIETEISYGITDDLDFKLVMPYEWKKETTEDETERGNGFGDVDLSLKWRFLEKEHISLAVKPFITLPTGSQEKELGTGKITYGAFLIAQTAIGKWEFYGNLGYYRNENKIDERKDIWHASIATEYEVSEDLSLVGNIGIEKNREKEFDDNPAFVLGGIVYSLSKRVNVDCGVKFGITKPETDYSILAGISFKL